MGVSRDVRELLADADPAGDLVVDEERARADLEAILLRPRERARGRWRARVLAAGLAGAAVAVALVLLPESGGGGSAYAYTPPPLDYVAIPTDRTPRELLEEIADRTAALPEPAGRADEISYRSWSLSTSITEEATESEIITSEAHVVLHPDGSRTATYTRPGGPETFEDAPDAWSRPAPAGEAFASWLEAAYGQPIQDPHFLESAIHDLLTSQVLSSGARAALLRMIAALPGLEYDGRVTDRIGRDGEAFSAMTSRGGLPTRHTFIIDPATGDLLGKEETLTENAGALNVPVPSVISYTAFLASHRTG
ncbi:hypothetical protein [Streptomyces sp. NPDC049881]|uniref:hypothetical protein n=1 Tax=Streptomyces sp. NPDC049881 TaxID=3155778 RepID=UPI0034267A9D